MRDAPWIERAERYGCEYMYEYLYGSERDCSENEDEEEEEDDEQDE